MVVLNSVQDINSNLYTFLVYYVIYFLFYRYTKKSMNRTFT